jgi:cytokinin dehydrogenase
MVRDTRIASASEALQRACKGEVSRDAALLTRYARNFGGMCECRPQLVLRPACAEDVPVALRVAAAHDLSVTVRGAGHSQATQNLGSGLVLDMTQLSSVLKIDRDAEALSVEGGARWADVMHAVVPLGLIPRGLTHALDTTVAGTLAVAGVGAQTFCAGPQVDQVLELDVATPAGEVIRCSAQRERPLFDAVRAGLGQCGVVLRVVYRLRACQSRMTTRCLGYRSTERFLEDLVRVAEPTSTSRWLTCGLAADPSRSGQLLLVLCVGEERPPEASRGSSAPSGLRADLELLTSHGPLWTSSGSPGHPFFRVFGPASEPLNPWLEHIVPLSQAGAALDLSRHVLRELGPMKTGILALRRAPDPAPLFVPNAAELTIGIGLFANMAPQQLSAAHEPMRAYAERMHALGGKRYLSGYVSWSTAQQWAAHYGGAWPELVRAKHHYDPDLRLNPGFIHWA